MPIRIDGQIGGSPDGNPEHGHPLEIKDQIFDNIEDAIIFIRKMIILSNIGPLDSPCMYGNLEINWMDQSK